MRTPPTERWTCCSSTYVERDIADTPVAQGWTNHEIADDMYISISTVKTHLASLMRKLGARNRVEIAMWAYETGRIKT